MGYQQSENYDASISIDTVLMWMWKKETYNSASGRLQRTQALGSQSV